MRAISIKQPWASLIAHGIKDIENRTWKCPQRYDNFYDSILTNVQLLALPENKQWDDFDFCVGAIIGSVVIADCVQNHPSVWAEKGCWNWVLKDAVLFNKPIMNVKGKLSFWEYEK